MELSLLYTVCVLGAVGLYLMIRPGRAALKGGGAIVALGVLIWLLMQIPGALGMSVEHRPPLFFWIFALIAVAAAGRMITHPRPVYCALYFIFVVLSSAAILLLLHAEFMAFALVIVYAGAILVTYLFVIMLAQQAPDADSEFTATRYDRIPREPAAAVVVGLLILAMLSQITMGFDETLAPTRSQSRALAEDWQALNDMPGRVETYIQRNTDHESFTLGWETEPGIIVLAPDLSSASARYTTADGAMQTIELPDTMKPENIQLVGLALVAKFPVSLEVAGVILLLAMFGAVVLARKQLELGEDELRQQIGMRRLPVDRDEPEPGTEGGTAS